MPPMHMLLLTPSRPHWNLLGFGNNNQYQVKLHGVTVDHGRPGLRFEHPLAEGPGAVGGWMMQEKQQEAGAGGSGGGLGV